MRHHNTVFQGVLKPLPWGVVERREAEHEADLDERALKAKPHLIALLLAQLFGLRSLRDIELQGTRVSSTGVTALSKALPDCKFLLRE